MVTTVRSCTIILRLGMVTTFFQMGETTEDPPFSPGYVSLRQLGNSNRILRLEYLKNCAEEGIRVFKEKAPRNKKEAEKRQRILERRFKYQLNRFKVWSLHDCYM